MRPSKALHSLSIAAVICACVVASGCSTGSPPPISNSELAHAETFPYYKIYWVGRRFGSYPVTAADGQKTYNSSIGDSVYYGDCVADKGILSTGSCKLPLQVTTVIYRLHSNSTLGKQRNTIIRGVPGTIYEEGRAIELYSGRVAIDIFSSSPAWTMRAAKELRPLNAPGSDTTSLPAPVFCPGLSGSIPGQVRKVLQALPGHACQVAETRITALKARTRRFGS